MGGMVHSNVLYIQQVLIVCSQIRAWGAEPISTLITSDEAPTKWEHIWLTLEERIRFGGEMKFMAFCPLQNCPFLHGTVRIEFRNSRTQSSWPNNAPKTVGENDEENYSCFTEYSTHWDQDSVPRRIARVPVHNPWIKRGDVYKHISRGQQ